MGFPCGSDSKESTYSAGDRVQSLRQEDALEKRMATHFSILAWGTPWTEESGRLHLWGRKEWDIAERRTPSLFPLFTNNPNPNCNPL